MIDEVITSRQAYIDTQSRFDALEDNEVQLESDELVCRKAIDKLISGDDSVAYQMKCDELTSIRSKREHLRKSKGIIRSELMEALSNYQSDLRARTISRKADLRGILQTKTSGLMDALTESASSYIVNKCWLDGLPIRALDINKILRKQDGFLDGIEARINHINSDLQED